MKRFELLTARSGVLLPLVFFTLFFIINSVVGLLTIRGVTQEQELVGLTRRNLNLLNELRIEVLRAESGQRGFLLTNLDSYVEPYNQAVRSIEGKIAAFPTSSLDETQQQRFMTLQAVIRDKMQELQFTVESMRANRDRDALRELFTHRGRDIMREFDDIVLQMDAHERVVLEQRMASAESGRVTSLYLVLAANIVGLVMVFVAYMLIRLGQRKEAGLLESLQRAHDTLEIKVEERTASLEQVTNELRRSNTELQDFAFVASHDLQEPLRKIRAFGDRLERQYSGLLGEEGGDYIRRMQNASQRMSTLIEDLLAFSRITTEATPFVMVDLNTVLSQVLEDLEVNITETAATVEVAALPVLEADRLQMQQLFLNLLSNALKFRSRERAPLVRVFVADIPSPINDSVTITVQDNGIGFDPVFADRIFLPFQRLHGKSEYKGSGIGLAICRRIVKRHNGLLTVDSEPGRGSSFHVTLPRRLPDTPGASS